MTPRSQAYSTNKPDAITRKFCPVLFTKIPWIKAKVTVVVAMISGVRFLRNSSVSNRLGMKKRKNSRLRTIANMIKAAMAINVPKIQ